MCGNILTTHLAQQALWTRYQNLIASSSSTVDTTPGNTLLLSVDGILRSQVVVTLHVSKSRLPNPRTWLCLWSSLRLTCRRGGSWLRREGKPAPTMSTGAPHPCGTYALQLCASSPIGPGVHSTKRTVWSGQLDAFAHITSKV